MAFSELWAWWTHGDAGECHTLRGHGGPYSHSYPCASLPSSCSWAIFFIINQESGKQSVFLSSVSHSSKLPTWRGVMEPQTYSHLVRSAGDNLVLAISLWRRNESLTCRAAPTSPVCPLPLYEGGMAITTHTVLLWHVILTWTSCGFPNMSMHRPLITPPDFYFFLLRGKKEAKISLANIFISNFLNSCAFPSSQHRQQISCLTAVVARRMFLIHLQLQRPH